MLTVEGGGLYTPVGALGNFDRLMLTYDGTSVYISPIGQNLF
jgi:hypothetical protein